MTFYSMNRRRVTIDYDYDSQCIQTRCIKEQVVVIRILALLGAGV